MPLKAGPLCSQLFKTGRGPVRPHPKVWSPTDGRGRGQGSRWLPPTWKPGSGQARRGDGGGETSCPRPRERPGLARRNVAAHVRTLLGQQGLPRAHGGQQVLPRVRGKSFTYRGLPPRTEVRPLAPVQAGREGALSESRGGSGGPRPSSGGWAGPLEPDTTPTQRETSAQRLSLSQPSVGLRVAGRGSDPHEAREELL